eukprot:4518142-Pyramimonas_sp.AAC.1
MKGEAEEEKQDEWKDCVKEGRTEDEKQEEEEEEEEEEGAHSREHPTPPHRSHPGRSPPLDHHAPSSRPRGGCYPVNLRPLAAHAAPAMRDYLGDHGGCFTVRLRLPSTQQQKNSKCEHPGTASPSVRRPWSLHRRPWRPCVAMR